jgi:hypothetical protein
MSYCRFQNTFQDLRECRAHLGENLGEDEHEARARLVEECRRIVSEAEGLGWYGDCWCGEEDGDFCGHAKHLDDWKFNDEEHDLFKEN